MDGAGKAGHPRSIEIGSGQLSPLDALKNSSPGGTLGKVVLSEGGSVADGAQRQAQSTSGGQPQDLQNRAVSAILVPVESAIDGESVANGESKARAPLSSLARSAAPSSPSVDKASSYVGNFDDFYPGGKHADNKQADSIERPKYSAIEKQLGQKLNLGAIHTDTLKLALTKAKTLNLSEIFEASHWGKNAIGTLSLDALPGLVRDLLSMQYSESNFDFLLEEAQFRKKPDVAGAQYLLERFWRDGSPEIVNLSDAELNEQRDAVRQVVENLNAPGDSKRSEAQQQLPHLFANSRGKVLDLIKSQSIVSSRGSQALETLVRNILVDQINIDLAERGGGGLLDRLRKSLGR